MVRDSDHTSEVTNIPYVNGMTKDRQGTQATGLEFLAINTSAKY